MLNTSLTLVSEKCNWFCRRCWFELFFLFGILGIEADALETRAITAKHAASLHHRPLRSFSCRPSADTPYSSVERLKFDDNDDDDNDNNRNNYNFAQPPVEPAPHFVHTMLSAPAEPDEDDDGHLVPLHAAGEPLIDFSESNLQPIPIVAIKQAINESKNWQKNKKVK